MVLQHSSVGNPYIGIPKQAFSLMPMKGYPTELCCNIIISYDYVQSTYNTTFYRLDPYSF